MTPPIFSALTMLSVTHNAFDMIEEIRKQFREDPGILAGTSLPDYKKCVSLAAHGALSSLVIPAFLGVGLPRLVGFILGPDALGGFWAAPSSRCDLCVIDVQRGRLWIMPKYIETGQFGGVGSDAQGGVVGDTVGDPFRIRLALREYTHRSHVAGVIVIRASHRSFPSLLKTFTGCL